MFSSIFYWDADEIKKNKTVISVAYKSNEYCRNRNTLFYMVASIGFYIVPLVVMTFTYFMILKIAISHIRAIESTQVSTISSPDSNTLSLSSTSFQGANNNNYNKNNMHQKKRKENRLRRKELKATKSVAIVYMAYVTCYLPSIIINILLELDRKQVDRLRPNKHLFLFIYYFFILLLPRIGTMINPIVYSFSNKQFRQAFRSVYNRMLGKFDSLSNSSSDDLQQQNERRLRGLTLGSIASTNSNNTPIQSPQFLHQHNQRDSSSLVYNKNNNFNSGYQSSVTSTNNILRT